MLSIGDLKACPERDNEWHTFSNKVTPTSRSHLLTALLPNKYIQTTTITNLSFEALKASKDFQHSG